MGVGSLRDSMFCVNEKCTRRVKRRGDLFCGGCFYRLPKEMRAKLFEPIYGGVAHIKKCLRYLEG